jgi:DnaK suppressor protein
MNRTTKELCRERLTELRSRLVDDVEHLLESVPDDLRAPGALSHVPTHLADQATEGMDKEVALIRNEQELQAAVRAAFERLDGGTFGRCQECGGEISDERLLAMPYAAYCIGCAQKLTAL